MGILTNPSLSRRNAFGRNLAKHKRKICIFLYIVSLIWFCLLAQEDYNHATYISENALSPGLVYSEIRQDAAVYANSLLEELEFQREQHKDEIPYTWIQAKMKQIGLEVYTHNFTLHYPFSGGRVYKGKNIYGILRAPRIGSTEGIVFSTPYRPLTSVQRETTPSIPALLAFAEFASTKTYWAKDLIFLVTDQEQLGMYAWLKAYHFGGHDDNSILKAGNLQGRSGSLQAAINLEIESFESGKVDIKFEGLNGQLPNLDLVNLVHRLVVRENILSKEKYKNSVKGNFKGQLLNMLSMMVTQSSGVPNGNHGLFHPYRIEALSLVVHKVDPTSKDFRSSKTLSPQILLKILEGISRSLNNLLERFHQSFFFYILVNHDRFISIGDYMPCLMLMVGAILIKSFLLWISINHQSKYELDSNIDDNFNSEEMNIKEEIILSYSGGHNFYDAIYLFGIAQIIGFMAYYLTQCQIISDFAFKNNITTELCIFVILGIVAFMGLFVFKLKKIDEHSSIEILHIIALLYLASALIVIGLLNFSLGFFIAVFTTPFAIFLDIKHGKILKCFSAIYMILIHPLTIVYSIVTILTYNTFPDKTLLQILKRSFKGTIDAIAFSLVDLLIYGNWIYKASTLVFFTSWILFWSLLRISIKSKKSTQKLKLKTN